jgi:hypothetical protein
MSADSSVTSDQQLRHTPGPWFLLTKNHCCVEASSGNVAVTNLARMSLADAQLIAAAPELLEALRTTLGIWVSLVNSGDAGNWDPEQEPHVIAARAAIAKATT